MLLNQKPSSQKIPNTDYRVQTEALCPSLDETNEIFLRKTFWVENSMVQLYSISIDIDNKDMLSRQSVYVGSNQTSRGCTVHKQ